MNHRKVNGWSPVKEVVRFTDWPAATVTLFGWDVTTGGLALTNVNGTLISDQFPLSVEFCHPRNLMMKFPLTVGVPESVPRVDRVKP